MIDWIDPLAQVTDHVTVAECLRLERENRMATEADGLNDQIKNNLIRLCEKIEEVRTLIGCPIRIHSMYRPPWYSELVGGTATDVHTRGLAVDFDCFPDATCDVVKSVLLPKLAALGIRMEDNGVGALWVHIDTAPVVNNIFFKP